MFIAIPVSTGELVDKITILEIKSQNIRAKTKLRNINSELNILNLQLKKLLRHSPKAPKIMQLKRKLQKINIRLWKVEDEIRRYEERKKFGNHFIQLARNIYKLNDERFTIKQKINVLHDSYIQEEKQYTDK